MKFTRLLTIGTLAAMFLISSTSVFAEEQVLNISYQTNVLKNMDDDTSVIKNKYVNMYKVKVVGNEYVGTRVKTLSTGKDGYQAVFTIKPGDIVHFIAFKNKATAKKAKNKTKMTADFYGVPPWKNFSVVGKPMELCHTAGVLTDKKLTNPDTGETFCTTGENGYIQSNLELSK